MGTWSIAIDCGTPQNFITWVKNSWTAVLAKQYHGASMNVPYLKNLSNTTTIEPESSTIFNAMTKPIVTLSYGRVGI